MPNKLIWYASYGSNLCEERFLCYIRGGRPTGAEKANAGCSDKTLPLAKEEIIICSDIYFANKSSSWSNGGVAFIQMDLNPQASTLGRMYLITEDQLLEVIQQENGKKKKPQIDFENLPSNGSLVFWEDSWYGSIIFLGNQDGYPIFTFTNARNISEFNKPSKEYLNIISKGVQETYQMEKAEIVNYILGKRGVLGNYTADELFEIL